VSQTRVLVVDDSPVMRQMIVMALRRRPGIVAVEAADGLEALRHLAEGRFDLLFVDLNMPNFDGMKLIRRVRDDPRQSGARICVVTTEGEQATEAQARGLGAQHFLRKPVQRRDIEGVLAEAISG
jgi:two-component system chemotaxis response regulator CheY